MNADKEPWELHTDFVDALARWNASLARTEGMGHLRQELLGE